MTVPVLTTVKPEANDWHMLTELKIGNVSIKLVQPPVEQPLIVAIGPPDCLVESPASRTWMPKVVNRAAMTCLVCIMDKCVCKRV